MPVTPPPPAPNRSQPATFSERMDTFLGWLVNFVPQLNSALTVIGANGFATVGGGANNITLTAGYPALVTGLEIRFKATQANTGAATINLDNFGVRQCRTIQGTPLPAGYIRTDVFTRAVYDGTYWVVERQVQRGSNANGNWLRLADGTQQCWHRIQGHPNGTTTQNNAGLWASDLVDWTYPMPFVDGPTINADSDFGSRIGGRGSTTSTTMAQVREYAFAASAAQGQLSVRAIGSWY